MMRRLLVIAAVAIGLAAALVGILTLRGYVTIKRHKSALGTLGHTRVRNYVGSWQEWANRPECPVVVPPEGARVAPH